MLRIRIGLSDHHIMLLKPEENDITFVKINWLRSWLKDQGVEV